MDDTITATSVDSSPAPAAPPSATTPEVSAPSPSSDRPTSMRDAFDRVTAKRTAAQGTTAATAPSAPVTPEGTTPAREPGPMPFPEHKRVLENARAETERVRQEWKDYEFARSIPAADLREFVEMARMQKGDPVALINHLASLAAADPVHGQALRSFAAKQLAAARGSQPDAPPTPDLEVTDQAGNVVSRTYSEQGIAKLIAHVQQQTADMLRKEFAPVRQTHEQIAQAQAHLAEQHEAQAWSADLGKDMNTWPGFHPEQNKAERAAVKARVIQLVEALPAAKQRDATVLENVLHKAYREVVHPKLPAMMQAQLAASLKHKAVAQVESPSGTAPVTTARPKNPKELAKFLEQRAAAKRGAMSERR